MFFYTSGTTGKPKGLMGRHLNLLHMLQVSRKRYGITATEIMPAVAGFTFSISMFELMSPLTVGGTLVVLDRQHVLDAEFMALQLQAVTFFHIGPGLLKNIVKCIKRDRDDMTVFQGVRHASSGGDMVPPELLTDMRAIFSRAEVYVIYGCS